MYKKSEKYKIILKGLINKDSVSTICKSAKIAPVTLWRWARDDKKLEQRMNDYKVSALEEALQKSSLGGFVTKTTEKFNKDGELIEKTTQMAPPNIIGIIFSLTNLKSDIWKNNRDKFMGTKDEGLKESEYQILTGEESEEAAEMLKEFEA